MASERNSYRLDDLCEFINGFSFKSTDYVPPTEDTIEVFRMGYIERGGGFKEDSTPVFVPRKYSRNIEKFMLRPGDITIAMTDMKNRVAILGNTAWIRDANRFALNQRVGCIRVKKPELLDGRFLYYYSNWSQHVEDLRSRANSGVQVNLSTSAIKESVLTIPSLDEQKTIAQILGALDDKIEVNRRMCKTLEEIARAVFRSWFVDFDPVHAKVKAITEGRDPERAAMAAIAGQTEAELDNICEEALDSLSATAALFPDSLSPCLIGFAPTGWEVKPLDEIADFVNGAACQKFRPEPGKPSLPVIKIRELNQGVTEQSDRARLKLPVKHRADDGDVLFSWSGTLLCKVWTGGPGFVNQHLFKVSSDVFPRWFYLAWTKYHIDAFAAIAADKVTTMGHIKRTHLSEALTVVPPSHVLTAMTKAMEPLVERQVQADLESRTLATHHNTILPKLISGELHLEDQMEDQNG